MLPGLFFRLMSILRFRRCWKVWSPRVPVSTGSGVPVFPVRRSPSTPRPMDPGSLRPMDHLKDQPLCLVDLHLFMSLFRIGSIHPIFGAPVGKFWVDKLKCIFLKGCHRVKDQNCPYFDISKHWFVHEGWICVSLYKISHVQRNKVTASFRLDVFLPSCFWCHVHVDM